MITVYRLSSLKGVEFWSTPGCHGQRTKLSDMFSASLVLGARKGECGRSWARTEQVEFQSGDILLVDAGEVQSSTLPVDRGFEFFTMFWSPEALGRAGTELGLTNPPHWGLTQVGKGPLSAALLELRDLLMSGASAESIERAYRVATAALLRHASRNTESPATHAGVHPCVRRAVDRVRANLGDALSLADLASEMNLSKFHFARSFQRSLGLPPHRYRKLLRLQCARRLLERGFSVTDAAFETGFADAPHLSRAFCEWLGVNPAAWRSAWCSNDPWRQSS